MVTKKKKTVKNVCEREREFVFVIPQHGSKKRSLGRKQKKVKVKVEVETEVETGLLVVHLWLVLSNRQIAK